MLASIRRISSITSFQEKILSDQDRLEPIVFDIWGDLLLKIIKQEADLSN